MDITLSISYTEYIYIYMYIFPLISPFHMNISIIYHQPVLKRSPTFSMQVEVWVALSNLGLLPHMDQDGDVSPVEGRSTTYLHTEKPRFHDHIHIYIVVGGLEPWNF